MSRIDDLIERLSPNGIEFRTLADVAKTVSGLTGKSKSDFSGGNSRFVSYKNAFANRAVDQTVRDFVRVAPNERQNRLRVGDVVFTGSSENTEDVGMSSVVLTEPTEPLYLNSFCFAVRFSNPELLDPDFSKHLFRSEMIRAQIRRAASGVTRINISRDRFSRIRFPIPPAEVQLEIVRVLDAFGALEAELEAELEARRHQYAYYRDLLATSSGATARWVQLGEVASVRVGQAPPDGVVVESGPFGFVNAGTSESGRAIEANTLGGAVTIPSRGHGGVGVVGFQTDDFWCGPLCYRIVSAHEGLRTRYLYHYLKSIQPSIRGLQQVGGTPALNRKELILVRVPVPQVDEQERIVNLLDKFDELVNDLSTGLPAELNARRKQYEHYRDRLLTFKELAA